MKAKCIALILLVLLVSCFAQKKSDDTGLFPYLAMSEMNTWGWRSTHFEPDGFKPYIDKLARHSNYKYITTTIRAPLVELTMDRVYQQIKRGAAYARTKGIGLVFDLDVRLARYAFMQKYPDEMQQLVMLKEIDMPATDDAVIEIKSVTFNDHYTGQTIKYIPLSGRLARVYAYDQRDGLIDPQSITDITDECEILAAYQDEVKVRIPNSPALLGKTFCAMALFTHFTPALFAPHLDEFQAGLVEKYKDVPLAGACKDEWGVPGRSIPNKDRYWYSPYRAERYAKISGGRHLLDDCLLMYKGFHGQERQRQAAINIYMDMNRQRNVEIETHFYKTVKSVFGEKAIVATHPTWWPFPDDHEMIKNGLSWWGSMRDVAQTDEITPYCARTALSKKWRSPFWVNMFYTNKVPPYFQEIWRSAMGGGRINFHGIYPVDTFVNRKYYVLLEDDLMKASSRLALVNYIVTEPLDCPIAVIFGHSCAMNWAGPGFDDVGVDLANSFWKAGYYADLIPTSEIYNGSLQMLDDGTIQYGAQTYKAAVLYHPEFERAEFADFFNTHSGKATTLYRIGDWTMDFSAKPVDSNSALPKTIISCFSNDECTKQVIEFLKSKNIESYTPAITLDYQNGDHYAVSKFRYKHLMPPTSGHVKYIDGTHAYFAGDTDVMGDPIHKTVEIDDQILEFDAVGVFAIRFDEQGQVEALAAGGLKSVKTGDFDLTLDQRADLALWMDSSGQWHGYTLDMEGAVPQALLEFTTDWQRQAFPEPLDYTLSK